MFVKLIRKHKNLPIWLNAAFVVSVEPSERGGSLVTPIGDGLDYDVKESPEEVLAMLEGQPQPMVVPVPAPKLLTPAPDDVSPDTWERGGSSETPPAEAEKPKTRRGAKPRAPRKASAASAPARAAAKGEGPSEAREASAPASASGAEPAPAQTAGAARRMPEAQLERLRKMQPGTVAKLRNTLEKQFHSADPEADMRALEAAGVLRTARGHVEWGAANPPPPLAPDEGNMV